MTVRLYQSTDSSAPVLTGQAGSLITLLDAILVNGYGSKAAAGWTKPLSTTNKAAYLQNLTGANNASGMYLYVDDNSPGGGAAKEARACGFETMSAITPVGTGQFPTSAQSAIGVGTLVIRKSLTADATARAWLAIANGQTLYLFINTGDTTTPAAGYYPFIFGDFKSYKVGGDPYAVGIIGRPVENTGSAQNDPLHGIGTMNGNFLYSVQITCLGHFAARSYTGVGGSVPVGKLIDQTKQGFINFNSTTYSGGYQNSTTAWANNASMAIGRSVPNLFPYPNPVDSSIWLSPCWQCQGSGVRGYYPGMWAPLHDRPIGHGDTYTVAGGNLNGKSMVSINIPAYINSVNDNGQIHIEYSDTWT